MGVVVRQKRKGRGEPWWVFVHTNGRIRSKQVGDRTAAEAVASAIRRKMKAGEFNIAASDAAKSPEFAAYANRFLEGYAKTACKRNTWMNYETIIDKHLVPVWNGRRLHEITRADVKQVLLQKQQTLSPKTVVNIKNLISGIFTHAYEDEILAMNPALKLGKYITKVDRRRHVNPMTREQAVKFLATARAHMPDFYVFLLCAFRTGMRLGELLGLAWADIDFQGNRIDVQRSYSHGYFTTPKSHKARIIDVSDQLRAGLLEHRDKLLAANRGRLPTCMAPGKRAVEGLVQLVFPSEVGGPLDGDNIRHRVFYKLLEAADLPACRFHDIRHTFASLLLAQGESLHYVKEQMGHASIQTTVDVYGHLVPGSNRNAVNRLDDLTEPTVRLAAAAAG